MSVKSACLFAVLALLFAGRLKSQEMIRGNSIVSRCYASGKVNKIYVPPPKSFYLNKGRKGGTVTIYYSGFSAAAKTAYQYAVSILQSALPADASFTIHATFAAMSQGTLGGTSAAGYILGASVNALNPYAYYPVALADKISGKKINSDSEGDISMSLNSSAAWYYGTDGQTPTDKYDFVTVVLHELCHGIGFIDSFTDSNGTGSYGIGSLPVIYDTFVEDATGKRLADTNSYKNNSSGLGTALTSGAVYFRGVIQGSRARLYAPSTFDGGSSISHLNETSYFGSNALMTPFVAFGEAIHSPGTITMAVLGDIGWINTRIIHTPFTDTEKNLGSITFTATILSDTAIDRNHVGLVYSFDSLKTRDTLFLSGQADGHTFSGDLTLPSYNTGITYYFTVNDYFGRVYRLPSVGEILPYSFYVGSDTVKPVIRYAPPDYLIDKTPSLKIRAMVTDNIGVDTVYVEYRKKGGSSVFLGLKHDSLDIYSNILDIRSLEMSGTDSLQFRIIATDSSSNSNTSYMPTVGFFSIKPEQTFGVQASYTTNFSGASGDFINRGFSVTTPSGFSDPALHSKHPYDSPDRADDSIVYTSVLRYPLKVDNSGIYFSYMEIVLVEPGETGSVYGSPYFYDYVVVEGSRDFGINWFPMAPGYDSRVNDTFLNDYNSAISGDNSTFQGTPSMFTKHTISVSTFTKFIKGDTLLVRFRLFSDPFAHGWGWALDDLTIRSVADDVQNTEEEKIAIYPNPGDGIIHLQQTGMAGVLTSYKVCDLAGKELKEGVFSSGDDAVIDISSAPPGFYLIVVKQGNKTRTFRYSKTV